MTNPLEIQKRIDLAISFKGLESAEAARRLKSFGYNELQNEKPKNIFRIVFDVMIEPVFLMLLICDILYFVLGDFGEGFFLIIYYNS
jgi:Ca2+-transporting ATPase